MDNPSHPELIPISMLNALEYCPRRFYYEFVQGEMLLNEYVIAGAHLHAEIDQPGQRSFADGTQIKRVMCVSETLGIVGFTDLVEVTGQQVIPVEYKHGRAGKWTNDHIQLCAQAMCLEEYLPEVAPILYGEVYYAASHQRVRVPFTLELRNKTYASIAQARVIANQRMPPPPLQGPIAKRCQQCSLNPLCLPEEVILLQGGSYANTLSQ